MNLIFLSLVLSQPAVPGYHPPVPGVLPPEPIVIRAGRHVRTLPADATAKQLLHARIAVGTLDRLDRERQVRRVPLPFFPRVRARLDARLLDRVPILAEMEPYTRAQNTQLLFNRTERQIVSRSVLKAKWNIPGGLEGVHGWKSRSFRLLTKPPVEYLGTIYVLNSFGYRQPEQGWKRSYHIGDCFVEELSTDTGPFELRVSEKRANGWEFYVAWSDPSARPIGYRRPTRKQCLACHNEAGTGSYNAGLVPGGDHVFSDPFKEVR